MPLNEIVRTTEGIEHTLFKFSIINKYDYLTAGWVIALQLYWSINVGQ